MRPPVHFVPPNDAADEAINPFESATDPSLFTEHKSPAVLSSSPIRPLRPIPSVPLERSLYPSHQSTKSETITVTNAKTLELDADRSLDMTPETFHNHINGNKDDPNQEKRIPASASSPFISSTHRRTDSRNSIRSDGSGLSDDAWNPLDSRSEPTCSPPGHTLSMAAFESQSHSQSQAQSPANRPGYNHASNTRSAILSSPKSDETEQHRLGNKGHSRSFSDTPGMPKQRGSFVRLPSYVYFSRVATTHDLQQMTTNTRSNQASKSPADPTSSEDESNLSQGTRGSGSKSPVNTTAPGPVKKPLFINTQSLSLSPHLNQITPLSIRPLSPSGSSSFYMAPDHSISTESSTPASPSHSAPAIVSPDLNESNSTSEPSPKVAARKALSRSHMSGPTEKSIVRSVSMAQIPSHNSIDLDDQNYVKDVLSIPQSASSGAIPSIKISPFQFFQRKSKQIPIVHNPESVAARFQSLINIPESTGVCDTTYPLNYPADAAMFPRPRVSPCLLQDFASRPCHSEMYRSQYVHSRSCSRAFLQMSVNAVPSNIELARACRLPFGGIVCPFATESGVDIPLSISPPGGIIRCRGCRAYLNPFCAFTDAGKNWACNMCFLVNEVPSDYFSPLGLDGQRVDQNTRPELRSGSYEYIATEEHCTRKSTDMYFLFVIDCSKKSVESGALRSICSALRDSLAEFANLVDENVLVGFMAYGEHINYFRFSEKTGRVSAYVVGDVLSRVLPHPFGHWIKLKPGIQYIINFLDKLPSQFNYVNTDASHLGLSLQSVLGLMSSQGGKVIILQASEPTKSVSNILGEKPKAEANSEDAVTLEFNPEYYEKLVAVFASSFISVDQFFLDTQPFSTNHMESLPKLTGGDIYRFPSFDPAQHTGSLHKQIFASLHRLAAMDCVMKIQCSPDFKISGIKGNLTVNPKGVCLLVCSDRFKSYSFNLELAQAEAKSKVCSIQVSLLYLCTSGVRKIRVHNIAIRVVASPADIYQAADGYALSHYLIRKGLQSPNDNMTAVVREDLVRLLGDILVSYYRVVTHRQNSGIILPDSLSLLPLYVLSLIKSPLFRNAGLQSQNKCLLDKLESKTEDFLLTFAYPVLIRLHSEYDSNQPLSPLRLTADVLNSGEVYFLYHLDTIHILVGKEVPQDRLALLFGVHSKNTLFECMTEIPITGSKENADLRDLIQHLEQYWPVDKIRIFMEGTIHERGFYDLLVEDRQDSVMSYFEFLCHLNRMVVVSFGRLSRLNSATS